ncbi:MAG: oxidoreductase [Mucilaginibacter sp.]|uniref:oxidoreductase n=1 Tax=Mucilaginibacter sp. TaxID=1882438 RepID=UPI0031A78A85
MWTKDNMTDQTGKTAIVTGGNTGIGYETVKALYEQGAHVVLACRDLEKGRVAANKIEQAGGTGKIEVALLDLASLASVKAFADDFIQKHAELHLLINNAGIMIPPAGFTAEGYESQFGVNYLAHFALTGYLYPLIKKTKDARIVTVTSMGYRHGSIEFDNLKSEKSYDAFREYCQSKLANLLFTLELQRRIVAKEDAVLSVAAHPGITKTDLSRHMSEEVFNDAVERWGPLMETEQGALPSLYAAVAEDVKGGEFYGPDGEDWLRGYPTVTPILENALDEAVAKKLWEMAEAATGVVFP